MLISVVVVKTEFKFTAGPDEMGIFIEVPMYFQAPGFHFNLDGWNLEAQAPFGLHVPSLPPKFPQPPHPPHHVTRS